MQQLVEGRRLDAQDRRVLRDALLADHLDGDAHRGLRGALSGARLQDVERPVLDGELDVLHVRVVAFEHLQRFRNVNYYRSSPCFNLDGNCTESAWSILKQGQDASTDAQKSANDAVLRGLDHHSQQIPLDAAQLQILQQRTQTAEGQMEALQYANQLAAHQANQLLQIRHLLIAQHNAINAQNQSKVDQEAMWQAARETATKRLSPQTLPTGRNWLVRDAF